MGNKLLWLSVIFYTLANNKPKEWDEMRNVMGVTFSLHLTLLLDWLCLSLSLNTMSQRPLMVKCVWKTIYLFYQKYQLFSGGFKTPIKICSYNRLSAKGQGRRSKYSIQVTHGSQNYPSYSHWMKKKSRILHG